MAITLPENGRNFVIYEEAVEGLSLILPIEEDPGWSLTLNTPHVCVICGREGAISIREALVDSIALGGPACLCFTIP